MAISVTYKEVDMVTTIGIDAYHGSAGDAAISGVEPTSI